MLTLEAIERALRGETIARALRDELASSPVSRHAAVAVILRPAEAGAEVLLMKRAESERDPWSGHISFPGGHHDKVDASLRHTAERETLEEVGLDLPRIGRFLGALEVLPAVARGRRTGMAISPFVYGLDQPALLHPNEEVAEVFWAGLRPLRDGEADTVRPYEHEGRRYDLPAFDIGGRIVWGLTYQMLLGLLGLLDPSCDR